MSDQIKIGDHVFIPIRFSVQYVGSDGQILFVPVGKPKEFLMTTLDNVKEWGDYSVKTISQLTSVQAETNNE
jgi:hypothetical protein